MFIPRSVPKRFVKFVQFVAFLLLAAPVYCNVLLVVNENSPESISIGDYYASKRNITRICRIRTAEVEAVSRETFENEILKPVAAYLRSNSLQDDILYIVTTRGVPMNVDGDSVDSALALTYRYMLTGGFPYKVRIENPYFTIAEPYRPFSRKDFDIYLVTRLISLELVDQAFSSDSAGGDFYFDLSSPQPSTESDWVRQASAILKKMGIRATVENTARVLDNLELVQGFATQHASDAPVIKWRPGAIATVMDKNAGQSAWSYVKSGVTGFGSYVGDPLADGYFRPQILFPAYATGRNLAEAFYASCRYVGGRNVVIGDPLVSPYSRKPQEFPPISMDRETGLPELFSQRRMSYLLQKYSTSKDAVSLLLKAEAAEGRGDRAAALALADRSLAQDPLLVEPTQLKSRLDPPAPPPQVSAPPPPAPAVPDPVKTPEVAMDFPVRVLSKSPIEYPAEAKAARVQGIVVVELLIDEMGQVMKANVVSGDRRLAKSVLASVKSWRFEPELENGRAVFSRLTIPFHFKINEKKP